MLRKVVALWVSLVMMFGFVVIITDEVPPAKAVTITVDDSGGAEYTKIQDAINASSDGDTVFVYNGTYYENVVVNKTINLTGEDRDYTIIQGNGTGDVVSITANSVNITYFTIIGSGSNTYDAGVKLISVQSCTIINITSTDNHEGIYLDHSNGNNITGNNCSMSKGHGIMLYYSNGNIITNNNISNNNYGIYTGYSNGNKIIQNVVMNNNNGISLAGSSRNDIDNNYIANSDFDGIRLSNSKENNLTGNIMIDNNIFISGGQLGSWNTHEIDTSNIVSSKPVYYIKNQTNGVVPPDAGQVIIANSSDITVENSNLIGGTIGIELGFSLNCTIKNNNISHQLYGFYIFHSTEINIEYNNISSNDHGIFLDESSNNKIENNNFTSNYWEGIYLTSSPNNTISWNTHLSYINYGIWLFSSRDNILQNNTCYGGRYGIFVLTDKFILDPHDHNTLENNNCSNNDNGIEISYSSSNIIRGNKLLSNYDAGISISNSDNNEMVSNNISLNTGYGAYLDVASINLLKDNFISNNTEYGIFLDSGSNNNMIYHNIFHYNNGTTDIHNSSNIQVCDVGGNNSWNSSYPIGGNYWSDYNGPDNFKGPQQDIPGSDSIGDIIYSIDPDSFDSYPLLAPFNPLENYTILKQGWNLISIPLIQDNQDLSKVLEMIDGYYDAVQWHDITVNGDHWKHHKVDKPYGNDLFEINETMGFWIHINQPGDTIFLYNGTQPSVNQSITLHPGWNMVGYPSLSNRNRTAALNNLDFGNDVDAIWTFNAATQTWQEIGQTDYFELGRGYWIHSKVTKVWDVPL